MSQHTLVILKPDAVEQGLESVIVEEFARAGLTVTARHPRRLDRAMLEEHYAHLADKPFFDGIVEFMTRGPCVVMRVIGPDAVAKVREIAGATNPEEAEPHTLRGRYGRRTPKAMENVLHASATPEEAEIEIARFFRVGGK